MDKWVKLLGLSTLMVVLGLVPLALGWSHLPDPAATHWGFGGAPDGYLPLWALPLLVVGIVAVGLLTTSLFRVEGRPTAEAFAMIGLTGAIGVALTSGLVILNWNAVSWEAADPFGFLHVVAVLALGLIGVVAGYRLGRHWYPPPVVDVSQRTATIDIAPGETVSWIGTCSVSWPYLILLPLAAVFVFTPGWLKLIGALVAVLAFMFASLYVSVTEDGMKVTLGGRVPAKTIGLERIKAVRPIDLEPAAWGGWGYRVVPSGSAVVLRRGDGIEVILENDRRFAVTVDDAATGAALLNGLIARHSLDS